MFYDSQRRAPTKGRPYRVFTDSLARFGSELIPREVLTQALNRRAIFQSSAIADCFASKVLPDVLFGFAVGFEAAAMPRR